MQRKVGQAKHESVLEDLLPDGAYGFASALYSSRRRPKTSMSRNEPERRTCWRKTPSWTKPVRVNKRTEGSLPLMIRHQIRCKLSSPKAKSSSSWSASTGKTLASLQFVRDGNTNLSMAIREIEAVQVDQATDLTLMADGKDEIALAVIPIRQQKIELLQIKRTNGGRKIIAQGR